MNANLPAQLRFAAQIVEENLRWKHRASPSEAWQNGINSRDYILNAIRLGHEIAIDEPEPVDPYAELKAAKSAGKVIQFKYRGAKEDAWTDISTPNWVDYCEYRIKPEPTYVPLGPEDVPPGSAIRHINIRNPWSFVLKVNSAGLCTIVRDYTWSYLHDHMQINRSLPLTGKWDPNAFEPCRKEAV